MKIQSLELEYKKNPQITRDEIQKLLEWIKQQPHLPQISENEAILFLHSCHYSMELAKKTIDINLTLRTHCPEFFSGWNFSNEDLKQARETVGIFPFQSITPEGYGIFCGKLCDLNTSHFVFADAIKLYCMLFSMWLLETGTAPGHLIVIDLKGVTLGHIARLSPFVMKKFLYYLQEAAPIRIAGFHFINIVPHTDKIISIMRPFLKKEMYDVLHLHSNVESLKKFIPLNILPQEYGGEDESTTEILIKNIYEKGLENQEFFTNEETRRIDENLRPGKPKNASTIFGAEGNFKKLDID